ncbi:AraC family transcriptional regulator [Aquihabitans sp. McL0605]|uniref:AraC family transcriptional regulator n=1 Tax=Aquihabitans sp. McL0605 TaxID=3415671 RepID=UPI003CF4AD52
MAERTVATPDPPSLDASLELIRLDGAIFFRGEFTEQWAFDSPVAEIAGIMRPGAERMILFHIVAAGTCWVSVVDGERHWAQQGDVIVLPYGDDYAMGGEDLGAEVVPILTLVARPPWDDLPVLRHGAGGDRTDIVCGYLYSEDPLFDPALRAFPPVFVVRPPAGPTASWVESSVTYALAASDPAAPARVPSTRLPELLLIEVLRLHLATAPAADHGWIAALRDPVLAPALGELHAAPERKWTVAELASAVAVSRSVLDERFRTVLGSSPIRYLTEWRMHVADDLLATTTHNLGEVARRVGYEAEESFSRAFKRSRGVSPGAWRAARLRTA